MNLRKKAVTIFTSLAIVLLLAFSENGATIPHAKAAGTGQFVVNGSKIYDPGGNEFVIKGVNVNGPRWPFARETTQDANLIANVWKFNTVRINTFPRMAQHGINNNLDLTAIINSFTSKNVVAMIENHDIYGTYAEANVTYDSSGNRIPSIQEMKDWWINIANTYKGNPYVWFNIANEPGLGSYSKADSINKWRDFHDEIIGAIRATGAQNIIVVDEHNWGQASGYTGGQSDSAVLSAGTFLTSKYSNITFGLHMYDNWINGANRLNSYLTNAQSKNLSVHIGEYGASNSSTALAMEAMFNTVINKNIGRIAWQWASEGDDHFDLTTGSNSGGGYEINQTNGSKPTNLTWMGNLIWDDNRGSLGSPVAQHNLSILENGFLENDMAYWNNWGRASTSTSFYKNGNRSLHINSGGTGGAGQAIGLRANTTYKLMSWGYDTADLGVKYKNAQGNDIQHILNFTGNNSWNWKETTFTTPADLTDGYVFIWKGDANSDFYADDIQLIKQ